MLLAVFQIIDLLLRVLLYIIIIQAVLSWLVAFNVINLQNDFVRSLLYGLDRLTEPLYRPFRKILPDMGGLDFAPMVVILLIIIAKDIILPKLMLSALSG
jgi:YggT family protein